MWSWHATRWPSWDMLGSSRAEPTTVGKRTQEQSKSNPRAVIASCSICDAHDSWVEGRAVDASQQSSELNQRGRRRRDCNIDAADWRARNLSPGPHSQESFSSGTWSGITLFSHRAVRFPQLRTTHALGRVLRLPRLSPQYANRVRPR